MHAPTLFMLMSAANPASVPVPTTVNGIVMGRPEDFSLSGPARVCLNVSAFDLTAGETAYVDYLGIHYGRLRIIGPQGVVDIGEGYTGSKGGRTVAQSGNRRIVRYTRGGERSFVLFAPTYLSEGEPHPIVRVQGPAVQSRANVHRVFSRISVLGEDYSGCTRRFEYGWSMVEPEEEKEEGQTPQ